MPKLVISAAHTSVSPGAIYKDLREFDLTRKLLQLCANHLQAEKIEHKTVPVDLNLIDRINWINNSGYTEQQGDIFIELHVNDGGKRGVEAWFSGDKGDDNNSQKLAEIVIDELCNITKFEKQGAKSEHEHELKSLLILNQTKPIAAAFELLYIDNEEDYAILKDEKKLDELAKNFVLAIKKYITAPPKLSVKAETPKNNMFGGGNFPDFSKGFGGGAFGGGGNAFGGDDLDSDPFSPSMGQSPAPAGGNNIMMDRDERKKMVNDMYNKMLGKEPNQADMNYFLNIGISEDQLIQRIVKSKDHEEMVKDAKEAKDLRDKSTKVDAELTKLRGQVKDLNAMHQTLQNLLAQKNLQIKQMQEEMIRNNVVLKGQYFDGGK